MWNGLWALRACGTAPAGRLRSEKGLQQLGVESAALPVPDHPQGLLAGEGVLVDPLAGQGVVYVRQGHHLGPDGDLVALETVGIAPAVPALVVVAGDVAGVEIGAALLHLGDLLQQGRALDRMGLHDFKLFFGELPGLAQDSVGDGDLAHVVHDGGQGDVVHIRLGKTVPQFRVGEQIMGDVVDAADMLADSSLRNSMAADSASTMPWLSRTIWAARSRSSACWRSTTPLSRARAWYSSTTDCTRRSTI